MKAIFLILTVDDEKYHVSSVLICTPAPVITSEAFFNSHRWFCLNRLFQLQLSRRCSSLSLQLIYKLKYFFGRVWMLKEWHHCTTITPWTQTQASELLYGKIMHNVGLSGSKKSLTFLQIFFGLIEAGHLTLPCFFSCVFVFLFDIFDQFPRHGLSCHQNGPFFQMKPTQNAEIVLDLPPSSAFRCSPLGVATADIWLLL